MIRKSSVNQQEKAYGNYSNSSSASPNSAPPEATGEPQSVPLVCTEEVVEAIYQELSMGGRVKVDICFAVKMAADWQRHRIIQELQSQLATPQQEQREITIRDGAESACTGLHGYLAGLRQGKVDVLESTIALLS